MEGQYDELMKLFDSYFTKTYKPEEKEEPDMLKLSNLNWKEMK